MAVPPADRLTRHELGVSLRMIAEEAARPSGQLIPTTAPHEALRWWRQALLGLAEWLEGPRQLNGPGLDRVRALVAEVVYAGDNSFTQHSLAETIWWVADGLQLCPPHRWGCPVVMKVDPEHVAWTCGRCGLVRASSDLSVTPS
jgi:hypothetical protein